MESPQNPVPGDVPVRTSRAVLVATCAGTLGLILVAAFCWGILESVLRVNRVLPDYEAGRYGYLRTVESLGGERAAGRRLAIYLRTPDRWAKNKEAAVYLAGNIGPEAASAAGALADMVADASNKFRWQALWALGRMGPRAGSAVPALERAMADRRWDRHAQAAVALTRIDPARSLPILIAMLADDEPHVRCAAANRLGELGAEAAPAVPALEEAIRKAGPDYQPDDDTLYSARTAREAIGKPERLLPPEEQDIQEKLGRRVPVFEFAGTPSDEAVVKLGELAGVKTVVDPVGPDTRVGTVSLRMRWVEAGAAMSWACRMGNCGFTVKDDAVHVLP